MARMICSTLAALALLGGVSGCVIHEHDRWRGRDRYYGRYDDDGERYGDRDRDCWREGGRWLCRR